MRHLLVLAMLLAACGDNIAPRSAVDTWGDAYYVWSDAWCQHAETCYPDDFVEVYGTQADCTSQVLELNCTYSACAEPYPQDRLRAIDDCYADMGVLVCTAENAPASCYAAYERP